MMLLVILNLVFVVNIVSSLGGKCTFTHDCTDPVEIQDAYEKCNFGKCKIVPLLWFGPQNECSSFKECKCSDNPKECFCIDNICKQEKWECHTNKDCQSMKKCQGKTCHCEGNTCEHQCSTTEDCDNPHFWCSWGNGVKCSCEVGMCRAIKITNPTGTPAPTTAKPKPIGCPGCPWEVTVLTEKHKEMVIFAIQQLHIPCRVKVEVIRFSEAVSAGSNYIFDVVIKYPSACGQGDHANREESECHLEVWEQPWTDTLEVYKKNCKHKYKV